MKITIEQAVGLGTLANGFIIAYFAYKQHQLNLRLSKIEKAKYISDLFERRFEIFRAAQELLSHIVTHAACTLGDIAKFTNKAQQGYFLFDDEVYQYLMEVRKNAVQLAVMGEARDRATDPTQRSNFSKQSTEALENLVNELSENKLFEKFKKYLRPVDSEK